MSSTYQGNPANCLNPSSVVTGITSGANSTITTFLPHSFVTGDLCYITGVVGLTNINNTPLAPWTITVLTSTTFQINNPAAVGSYTSGGAVYGLSVVGTAGMGGPSVPIPSDGDSFRAAAFNQTNQPVLDRIAFLEQQIMTLFQGLSTGQTFPNGQPNGYVGSGASTGAAGVIGNGTVAFPGVSGNGGSGGGAGCSGVGNGGGPGLAGTATGNGAGATCAGSGSGNGVNGTGGATGNGGNFTGGTTSGAGCIGTGGVAGGWGCVGNGTGSFPGVLGYGNGGGGVVGIAQSGNQPGVSGTGSGTGAGGFFVAGTGDAITASGGPLSLAGVVAPATPAANRLYADSIPKCFGNVITNGTGGVNIVNGVNISAGSPPTLPSSTTIQINFATPMASATYTIIPGTILSGGNVFFATVSSQTTTGFVLAITAALNTAVALNLQTTSGAVISFAVFGKQ